MSSNLPLLPDPPAHASPAPARPGLGPALAPPGGAAGPGDLGRFLLAVLRYRWLVLAMSVAGVAAGIAAARLVRPEYLAQGTVWVETDERQDPNGGPIRSAGLLESYAWVELLKSYTVLDAVVRGERLYVEAALPGDAGALASLAPGERMVPGRYRLEVGPDGRRWTLSSGEEVVQRGKAGEAVGTPAGFSWRPPDAVLRPGRVVEFTLANPRDVARALGDRLDAGMADDGHFLRLSLPGNDPRRITATLNAVMDRYVEVAARLKRARLDQLTAILEEQREYAERNLHDAEAALEGFRVRTVTLPSDRATPVAPGLALTRDPVFASYFDMKVHREELARDREAVQRVLEQSRAGRTSMDALAVVPAVQASPDLMRMLSDRTTRRAELRALRQHYTDEAPAVRRATEELQALEGTTIPQAAAQLATSLLSREEELSSRIDAASGELRQIPPRAIEEARLQRRVEIATTLYGTLRQRYEEARLAAVSSVPDLRVLDRAAVPSAPVKDRRLMIVALCFGAAVAIALMAVLLLERTDRRVRYPAQVTGEMGLPVLGAVPYARGALAARDAQSASQIAEAFRELRLSVAHAHGTAGPLLVTVTSPESGDGKSTVAAGLALAFAEQGYTTVLVDGDVRRGALHRQFGLARTPGLTDCLRGDLPLEGVLTPAGAFTLVPSGTRMKGGPELLGSPAMGEVLAALRTRFEVIVLDSPPLGAGVDAYILGTVAGSMVLVLRTGSTDGGVAEAKLDLLDRLPVRVLGAVLNAVPPTRAYRYYSYIPGYEAEDEVNRALTRA
jgi:capsular exopolysaccharide synthesis family protein